MITNSGIEVFWLIASMLAFMAGVLVGIMWKRKR